MHDLSLHLLDIVQNSVKACAQHIQVTIEADRPADLFRLTIVDNGQGMAPDLLARVTDPFVTTRTSRAVGLGLPLLKELCETTGGQLWLDSQPGQGTSLVAEMGLASIDRPPLGDLGATWIVLLAGSPDVDFTLELRAEDRQENIDTADLRVVLDGVSLNEPAVLSWIKDYVAEMQQKIFGGVLHEIFS